VTIGVASICERGECFVLGSDMRATYGTTPHGKHYERVGPNDQCGKVFYVMPRLVGCVAGRMTECHAVISHARTDLIKLAKARKLKREFIPAIVDAARVREMRRIYNWTLERNWGISLRDFATGKVPGGKLDQLLIRACHHLLKDALLRVHLLVVGFVNGHGVFLRAVQKEPLQEESSPGVYVIGAGSLHAMRVLNRRGQNHGMSLPRTLLHIHEAMCEARKESTVGPAFGYLIIRQRVPTILFLPSSATILEDWRKSYAKRTTTASLDDSRVAGFQIYQQLQVFEVPHQYKRRPK
jgi:hypothetical protein